MHELYRLYYSTAGTVSHCLSTELSVHELPRRPAPARLRSVSVATPPVPCEDWIELQYNEPEAQKLLLMISRDGLWSVYYQSKLSSSPRRAQGGLF